jgi:hypothetical protein
MPEAVWTLTNETSTNTASAALPKGKARRKPLPTW